MKVLVVAGGSRGDVEPLVALGAGIRAAGHAVTIAATSDMAELVRAGGLAFHGLGFTSTEQIQSESGAAWISTSSGNPFRELRLLHRVGREWAATIADALMPLVGTADLMVSGILSLDAVEAIAEHDGVPHRTALLSPFHASADGRVGLTAPLPRHVSPVNRASAVASQLVVAGTFGVTGREVRRRLGRPTGGRRDFLRALARTPAVVGASPLLVPRPADWPAHVRLTGRWTLPTPSGWEPAPELVAFLDDGSAPVYVGFGSMAEAGREGVEALVQDAARRAGTRVLLRDPDVTRPVRLDERVLAIGDVPHGWLLPRTAAAVHHGGAGTTHAAVRAGIGSAAVPHIGDQPYWARRVVELGIGAGPLPRHRLRADRLAGLLTELLTRPGLAERAAVAGARLRTEDGVTTAVAALGL